MQLTLQASAQAKAEPKLSPNPKPFFPIGSDQEMDGDKDEDFDGRGDGEAVSDVTETSLLLISSAGERSMNPFCKLFPPNTE